MTNATVATTSPTCAGRSKRVRNVERAATGATFPVLAVTGGRRARSESSGRDARSIAHSSMDQRDAKQIPRDTQRQCGARAHARSASIGPAHGHDREAVATPTGEIDQLDVEDDALDP